MTPELCGVSISQWIGGPTNRPQYSVTGNYMYSGHIIPLIVMNGVSHEGLFKASPTAWGARDRAVITLTTQLF